MTLDIEAPERLLAATDAEPHEHLGTDVAQAVYRIFEDER